VALVRWLVLLVGVGLWTGGLTWFVVGSHVGGGALVLAGGLCLAIAAAGGWDQFRSGLLNWLLFWR
jgi:hypothetical protein